MLIKSYFGYHFLLFCTSKKCVDNRAVLQLSVLSCREQPNIKVTSRVPRDQSRIDVIKLSGLKPSTNDLPPGFSS